MRISKCVYKSLICSCAIMAWLSLFCVNTVMAASEELQKARMEYICALASAASYDNKLNQAVREELMNQGWEFKEFHNENRRADSNFFVITRPDDSGRMQTIIAIPGTEKAKDIEVDMRTSKVRFGGASPEEFQKVADGASAVNESELYPMVHRGFHDYTQTAFFTPNEDGHMGMEYLLGGIYGNETVYITGHSLGGAAATLLGARLLSMPELDTADNKLKIISFGAPAVGNKQFAELFDGRLDLNRMTVAYDPVKEALQALPFSGYVQFGKVEQWKRNTTVQRFHHEMSVYLDCALRNYYDRLASESDTDKKQLETGNASVSVWSDMRASSAFSSSKAPKIFVAPVTAKLHQDIQCDARYMSCVMKDMLLHQLGGTIASNDEVLDFADTLEAARDAGCSYILMETITGTKPKDKQYTYDIMVEEMIYDTSGMLIGMQTVSTSTDSITPIEAVMYDVARGNEARRAAIASKRSSFGTPLYE